MSAIIRNLIVAAAIAHGVSTTDMVAVAQCESSGDPFATNGPNVGLYQLSRYGKLPAFDAWTLAQGIPDEWRDPSAQSNFTAEQFAAGEQGAWSCWRILHPLSFVPAASTYVRGQ